eukprot:TRINITY_DN10933_c0_g1_i5.p1 TRINITY_DN10933_c0_g1~~TRINITY_DN10933_c0_g1_i5.p1  ORF type:complete len:554 (-),score=158.12 TRINITY_DN10933_c0_g1_i5:43-1704(-)
MSNLLKSVKNTGTNVKKLREEADVKGDLATVAENKKSTQSTIFPPPPLTCSGVFDTFKKIAHSGAANAKVGHIKKLMGAAKSLELRYLVRSLQGKMRIGSNESTVMSALAKALVLTPPGEYKENSTIQELDKSYGKLVDIESQIETALAIIKKVHSEVPNWDLIVSAILEHGLKGLSKHCKLTPGVPVKAMLAKPTKGIAEILDRLKQLLFTLEFKYDGERAQIHVLPNGTVKIFSRNAEDNSSKFPDLFEPLKKSLEGTDVTSCIIDSEVVAFDPNNGKILPFQVLSTRKRKDVDASTISVQVAIYAFDVLYLNGHSLLEKPLIERRKILHQHLKPIPGKVMYAEYMDTSDPQEIEKFLNFAIENNCEGLMVKTLEEEASYEPDKRSHSWLKVKKDYLDGVTDTLDLVPIGAYPGKGKRTGVFGAYLLACYDADNDMYQSICRIGTGFSDQVLEELYNATKDGEVIKPPSNFMYPSNDVPEYWFEPKFVWEILAADLSLSPAHKAAVGLVDENKGIALRFPRFIKVRTDKSAEDATTAEQVAEMFNNQHQRK